MRDCLYYYYYDRLEYHLIDSAMISDCRMLEHSASPAVQSPDAHSLPPMDDDETETIQLIASPVHRPDSGQLITPQEIDCKKKRGSKGKKP